MANFNSRHAMLVGLKGDSAFIRYSAHADGTDFTETRSNGQNYIGVATGLVAPTDKGEYTWAAFTADLGDVAAALDSIIAIQESLIGGDTV